MCLKRLQTRRVHLSLVMKVDLMWTDLNIVLLAHKLKSKKKEHGVQSNYAVLWDDNRTLQMLQGGPRWANMFGDPSLKGAFPFSSEVVH